MANWIPISERTPERDELVMLYDPKQASWVNQGYVLDLWYDGGKKKYTHWMPLPKAPDLTL